ncbi:hypothetical protein [Streptomyces sp. NRRL S-146]|uniref:hypothetical protein n=1 Tax=Streptomyces sp. NRRL S-146 TaxID=1463884 RepID=UPI0018FEF679|nr:hypothetical protein [Streptomyces sp. NRRL S-146]
MPKFEGETPGSIGNEVSAGAEVAVETGPVQGRAEMVVVLAQQGIGRNEISRRTGIPAVSVSRIAEANGITFDGRQVEVALRARIAELKQAQAGIALGLHEDIAVARMLLRTARTHRDYAFAAKAISDLTQSAQRMTPEISEQEALEETKDFLKDFAADLRAARTSFEMEYGIPLESPEATKLAREQLGLDKQDD